MSREKEGKISTGGSRDLSNSAFAGLHLDGLPEGTAKPPTERADSKRGARKSGGGKGRVEVRREKAGRGGKTVTTLRGFAPAVTIPALEDLTRSFKKKFACGGVLKGRVVELQGDRTESAMEQLSALGFRPVRAGG